MRVRINGVTLYFDVENAGLVADGPGMREKPTLVLLHGGPGADHSLFKPDYGALADVAQVIYLDHRGNGRSDDGDPSTWTLAQWGDDVAAFCDALGIVKPIVCGVSFGGFVAQAYATRQPGHAGKLILTSTAARFDFPAMFEAFERIGGPEARQAAEAYWSQPTPERRATYHKICLPLYRTGAPDPHMMTRLIMKNPVAMHFNGLHNEQGRMDFRAALAGVRCPTLVMAGEQDPITPVAFSEVIARSLPAHLMRFERFAGCGHGVTGDDPAAAFAVMRDFIQGGAS
jgi:pimeloyl-ACP methyl ester carboxylesterase